MTAWPWLAVAGVGALHGLNPATGWAVVAASGVRAGGHAFAWRALVPIAAGHAASVAVIAALAAAGLVAERGVLPWLAGGLAVFVAAVQVSGHLPRGLHCVAGRTGLALWSLAMGAVHGAGVMLVPALVPLCLSGSPAREITASGSMVLALAAVGVHMGAMLGVTAGMAAVACRGWGGLGRWVGSLRDAGGWAVTGAVLPWRGGLSVLTCHARHGKACRAVGGGASPYNRKLSGTHYQLEPKFKTPVLSFQGALKNMARAAIVQQIAATKTKA